jgi:phenylpropionate dioxygenase-like ring-hydroxylating dioxygenase large terminal subunit
MTANSVFRDKKRGHGSKERPVTKELWARDSQRKNVAMDQAGNYEPANEQIDLSRYHDPAFFRLELERLWTKTWLFACRDEDIPQVGDRVPFVVGPVSYFIVRSEEDEFKAFYNSCLHRGTQLCSKLESAETIRCPFHGWEWNVDGSLKRIPSHWDFPTMSRETGALREVRIGRWGGFIFINADPHAPTFEEALGVMPEHFRDFKPESRYTAARFRKLLGANWKVAQEAFMESYHVLTTHPAAVPYNGDSQSQYDIWDTKFGHIGRQITPSAVPSMHAGPDASVIDAANAYATIMKTWHYPDVELPSLNPTRDLRAQLGEWHREIQVNRYQREVSSPDAVMIDSVLYFMFPHFVLWLSESIPFVYQFIPHKTDPELCFFDVRMLMPYPEGSARPPSSPNIEIGLNELIVEKAPAFGFLGVVFDQDMVNMPLIQAGVRSADPMRAHSQLGRYQEMLIQYHHELLTRYLKVL